MRNHRLPIIASGVSLSFSVVLLASSVYSLAKNGDFTTNPQLTITAFLLNQSGVMLARILDPESRYPSRQTLEDLQTTTTYLAGADFVMGPSSFFRMPLLVMAAQSVAATVDVVNQYRANNP